MERLYCNELIHFMLCSGTILEVAFEWVENIKLTYAGGGKPSIREDGVIITEAGILHTGLDQLTNTLHHMLLCAGLHSHTRGFRPHQQLLSMEKV